MMFQKLILFTGLVLAATWNAQAYNWDEIPAEDLNATECRLDPSAAAEVLYKQVVVDQARYENRFHAYTLRMKIYKESAVERFRKRRIRYSSVYRPSSVRARVVKPDGQTYELDKDDIFKDTVQRKGGESMRSISFSLPQVEVGDIVEMHYRLHLDEGYYIPEVREFFQEDFPIRKVHLRIRPFNPNGAGFKWTYHKYSKPLKKKGDGFYEVTLEDVAAYPDEPHQLPDRSGKAWLVFYNVQSLRSGEAYWKSVAKDLYKDTETIGKADSKIKAKAKEITKGISEPQEKLKALYDFCRSEIINSVHGKAGRLKPELKKKLKRELSASKILSQGYGNPYNISVLFCSLARAQGFDARLVAAADRGRSKFFKSLENVKLALPATLVAVKNGEEWDFYDVGSRYRAFGDLGWKQDGVGALIADKKDALLKSTPLADPSVNRTNTDADFELDKDGTLSGEVTITAKGNYDFMMKDMLDNKSQKASEDLIKKQLKKTWPNASFKGFEFSDASDPFEPMRISFNVRIPQYAEILGDRIFIQPSVFHKHDKPEFPDAERKTDIFFNFKYNETESIVIKWPEGYELEGGTAPSPVLAKGFVDYQPRIRISKKSRKLMYDRSLEFHGRRHIPKAYPAVRTIFNRWRTQDQHVITLKAIRSDEVAAASE